MPNINFKYVFWAAALCCAVPAVFYKSFGLDEVQRWQFWIAFMVVAGLYILFIGYHLVRQMEISAKEGHKYYGLEADDFVDTGTYLKGHPLLPLKQRNTKICRDGDSLSIWAGSDMEEIRTLRSYPHPLDACIPIKGIISVYAEKETITFWGRSKSHLRIEWREEETGTPHETFFLFRGRNCSERATAASRGVSRLIYEERSR